MMEYNVEKAQKDYLIELENLENSNVRLSESQQAILFGKHLVRQTAYNSPKITFCRDGELFVSKTPTGYDIVGYYTEENGIKNPFSVTVCKVGELWYPARKYVAADTKGCSSSILLWVFISLGCTLMGILMYFMMSAAIGI